jgi:hypothetical protein
VSRNALAELETNRLIMKQAIGARFTGVDARARCERADWSQQCALAALSGGLALSLQAGEAMSIRTLR